MKHYNLLLAAAILMAPNMVSAQNINEEFDTIDTDGDGYISARELNEAQNGTMDQQNSDIMKTLDADGNETVSLTEYTEFYTKLSQEKSIKELESNFKALDTDGNGKLDMNELKDFRTETLDDTNNAVIEALDTDKDGKISRQEFAAFVRSLQVMFGGIEDK